MPDAYNPYPTPEALNDHLLEQVRELTAEVERLQRANGQRDQRACIVAWLRKEADGYEAEGLKEWAYAYRRAAASIERGEYEEGLCQTS